ncbi:MAG: homoserine dehydrogenase [Myxococcota bacterium]
MRGIAIGLLGAGNVGGGVVRILQENRDAIERRLGARVTVKRVLVRSVERPRDVPIDPTLLTTSADEVIGDPEVRVVVELVGGIEPAKKWVLDAMRHGKHVVTANKALLAEHGAELFTEAGKCGVSIFFEGSVAGGIPVLRALREGLASDRIESLLGIVNGTSNYILDAMSRSGVAYEEALRAAQAAGFAEADPTLDVSGKDAAQKLALLALVSFGIRVDPGAIHTEGITQIRAFDHEMAAELGYVIKSLAIARNSDAGVHLAVHPTLVPRQHLLANVQGSFNAVLVQSAALGASLYYGRGAGMMPTGMAVVSDIIEVCRGLLAFAEGGPPAQAFASIARAQPVRADEDRTENYLCVQVPNVPGVLGRVASCLGAHGLSIKRVYQDTTKDAPAVDLVVMTERCREADVVAALDELSAMDDVLAPAQRLRVLASAADD